MYKINLQLDKAGTSPMSGNTWKETMLNQYLHIGPMHFRHITNQIPYSVVPCRIPYTSRLAEGQSVCVPAKGP